MAVKRRGLVHKLAPTAVPVVYFIPEQSFIRGVVGSQG